MIDSLIYAKLLQHLKKIKNIVYSEGGTYDQIVAQLEPELEFSGLKTDGELPIPTITTATTTKNQKLNHKMPSNNNFFCR